MDIPVELNLSRVLKLPKCKDLKLPKAGPISITLPTGAKLKAIGDLSQGIPTDCSMSFSLLVQLAPLLGSMECLFKVLKLLKPLIAVIQDLPFPSPKLLKDFADAACDLAPCLLVPTPAAMIPFVRDILCLILKVMRCFLSQMTSILNVMEGLTLQIDAAKLAGNAALLSALECAKANAVTSAEQMSKSLEPVTVILDLVGPLMGIAGIQPIQLPTIGSAGDTASLRQMLTTVGGVVDTVQQVVDTLGGCGS